MTRVNRGGSVGPIDDSFDVHALDEQTKSTSRQVRGDSGRLNEPGRATGFTYIQAELGRLFSLIDRLDREGRFDSIATGAGNGVAPRAATAGGLADPALERELGERRARARLGGEGRPAVQAKGRQELSPLAEDAAWFRKAGAELGVIEKAGKAAEPRIIEYFAATWQPRSDDSGKENAWCAAFVTWSLDQAGVVHRKAVGARAYENYGEPSEPFRGAIAVLQKGNQKHVAFVAGVNERGDYVFLGGNQGNKVSTSSLPDYEIVAIRKPAGYEVPAALRLLPLVADARAESTR